jgi:hypothetical protein
VGKELNWLGAEAKTRMADCGGVGKRGGIGWLGVVASVTSARTSTSCPSGGSGCGTTIDNVEEIGIQLWLE